MRSQLNLIAAIVTCVAGLVLDTSQVQRGASQMGPHADRFTGKPGPPPRKDTQQYKNQKVKFKRDGSVQGFFDDDFANDAVWAKFTEKGGALVCGLNANDEQAGLLMRDTRSPPSAASPWTGTLRRELGTWGWNEVHPSTYSCKMDEHWRIPEAMKALGLDGMPTAQGGNNKCYRVEHWDPKAMENGRQVPAINQWYAVDGAQYQATNAHFEFALNPPGGAIYAFFLESPVHAATALWHNHRRPADPAKLPQLRAFSDVLWGYWNRDNAHVKDIKYFFMMGISNDDTNALIATCLEHRNEVLREWPGAVFDTSTDEGHALLGSPNGAAFAYFLMRHKHELGVKTISKVTVFRAETDDDTAFVDPNLLFWVEDVEWSGGKDGEDDEVERGEMMGGQRASSERTFKL